MLTMDQISKELEAMLKQYPDFYLSVTDLLCLYVFCFRLWIHFCAIYIFTAVVCSLLYYVRRLLFCPSILLYIAYMGT